jgi:quercetin dioxygenase-like cupin family protein
LEKGGNVKHSRRSFLSRSAAAGALVFTESGIAQPSVAPVIEPKLVRAHEGTQLWVLDILMTIKADSRLTGGTYAVFEDLVYPGRGVPLHVHSREDETICVLEGELEIVLGDHTYSARVGDFAHMPRNVPHRFHNRGANPARMILSFTPGGGERLFTEIGRPVADLGAGPPAVTPDYIRHVREVAGHYGMKWL